MLLSAIGQETSVTSSTNQMKKRVALLVFSRHSVFVFLQVNSRFYWDTCGSPVIKCLCFFAFFFPPATKWRNGAIVPSGHWALNTVTSNCDPIGCSHADHACYLDDDWRRHAQTGPGHTTNHEIFAYKTLLSVVLYFNIFGLRSPGALWRKRSKYLQTHIQVVLFAANPH